MSFTQGVSIFRFTVSTVRAYQWFKLAAALGNADASKNRDISAKQLTQQQLAEAEKMAQECHQRNFKGCD